MSFNCFCGWKDISFLWVPKLESFLSHSSSLFLSLPFFLLVLSIGKGMDEKISARFGGIRVSRYNDIEFGYTHKILWNEK